MAVPTVKPPEPPIPASVAADGDIREFYAGYLADYISGPGTARQRRGFPLTDQFQQGGDLTWWDLYCQDLKSVWDGVVDVFEGGAEAITDYQETKQSIIDLIEGAKDEWRKFLEGRDLEEPTKDDRKRTSQVVTLMEAQQAIERFRLDNLKDVFEEQIQRITDQIELIRHGAEILTEGAAAYAGKPNASGLAAAGAALNQLQQASGYVQEICAALLEIVKLFDFISLIEDDLEEKVLGQGNPQDNPKTILSRRA